MHFNFGILPTKVDNFFSLRLEQILYYIWSKQLPPPPEQTKID